MELYEGSSASYERHCTLYHQQSQLIQERFFQQFNMALYPCTHTYLACAERRAVDTWGIVHTMLAKHPEVVIAAPKLLKVPGQMESRQIAHKTTFRAHPWGIQEPIGADS